MSKAWQLQEAKNKFSEVLNCALSEGPQIITRHGEETAIILSIKDYKKIIKPKSNLVDFLKKSPLQGSKLSLQRSRELSRKVEL